MKKFIFDLITSPYSLFDDPIYNYVAMAIVGSIAFIIAWNIVGKSGIRGELGSILHWTIRIIAFIVLWILFSILISIIIFIINNWTMILMCLIILIVLLIIERYAKKHSNSFWNKKLF